MAVDPTSVSAATQVTGAIRQASRSTGASFDYLLATARIESNLNPSAQASTSSAKGLFQFIEQTWLGTMKSSGASLGYGQYADAISLNGSTGRYEVSDPATRDAIMHLRSDPAASAAMAGAFTRSNAAQLSNALGRRPTDGELYIAHFLGPEGAGKLINSATSQPNTSAADLFPHAAQSNRSIFYDRSGRARATSEVYAVLANKLDAARVAAVAPGLRGAVAPEEAAPPASYVQDSLTARLAPIPVAAAVPAPDTAAVAQAYAQTQQTNVIQNIATDPKPIAGGQGFFQAMFTSREGQPVAPVVQSLWTDAPQPESAKVRPQRTAAAVNPPAAPANRVKPLELFQDQPRDGRRIFTGGA